MMGGLQRAPENSIVLQSFLELLSLLQLLQKLWVLWSSLEISGDHPGFADVHSHCKLKNSLNNKIKHLRVPMSVGFEMVR